MLNRDKGSILGPLELTNLFEPSNKVVYLKKLVFQSAVRFLILFVLVDAILLNLDLQKRPLVKFFFQVSTLFSNIFAPYIQNLETCFAISIYFDFDYV